MQKIYHLSSCSTCKRILKELEGAEGFVLQDIKADPITPSQIDEMARMTGSYEELFSRRAMKYRAMGLHEQELQEEDYRKLILEEYTFLKRPVMIIGEEIFVGNSKKVIQSVKDKLGI
jgi:arsenate reductase